MSAMALATVALSSAIAGFASLSLAMDRHYADCVGRGASPADKRLWLRLGGALGLVASLAASLMLQGPSQGWVLWFGVLTAAALLTVGVLAFKARFTAAWAGAMALLAVLAYIGVCWGIGD